MQEVIKGLWISDYEGSQKQDGLEQNGIKNVITAMRQKYDSKLNVLHIPIDDTDTTNIIIHFPETNAFISAALEREEGVLVHCQAGVSRSTTLVAAFLMAEFELDVEQAVEMVRAVRSQAEPTEFFMTQLEMYERCEYEWNPVKWNEQRRFLMNFARAQVMGGGSPSIVMAYYPSPAPSPRASFSENVGGLRMTPVDTSAIDPSLLRRRRSSGASTSSRSSGLNPFTKFTKVDSSMLGSAVDDDGPDLLMEEKKKALSETPMRKRLTPRKADRTVAPVLPPQKQAVMEKIGSKAEVVVTGRRIRCRMCRRELAAREHIIAHEPGKGQQAFAPHRRDMGAHRAEQEKRKYNNGDQGQNEGVTKGVAALRVSRPLAGPPRQVIRDPRSQAPESGTATSTEEPTSTRSDKQDISISPEAIESAPVTEEPDELPAQAFPQHSSPSDPPLLASSTCSSYFVEPLSWMSSTLEGAVQAGRIECPNKKCGAKLGSFDWAGSQCSCGAWVVPGFALNVSKVDEYKPSSVVLP